MHKFLYTGIHVSGKPTSGEICAASKSEAVNLLRQKNLRALTVWSNTRGIRSRILFSLLPANLSFFTAQFASMVSTGLSPAESLEILAARPEHWRIRTQLCRIRSAIDTGGKCLADAFAEQGELFDRFYRTMIKIGESSNNLKETLAVLAAYYERTYGLNSRIRTMTSYPLMFAAMAFSGLSFFISVAAPKFSVLNTGFAELPAVTRTVGKFSVFAGENLLLILGIPIFIFVLLYMLRATGKGKKIIDNILSILPIAGDVQRKSTIVQFFHMLAALTSNGAVLSKAVPIAAGSLEYGITANRLSKISGTEKTFSKSLAAAGVIPEMIARIIDLETKTGDLPGTLKSIAYFYEEETDAAIQAFNSIIEPMLIFVTGLVVTAILAAIYIIPGSNAAF